MFQAKVPMFFLSDKGPSLKTLDNYSHISAVLKPFWLFHFDFHTAYAALHFYFMDVKEYISRCKTCTTFTPANDKKKWLWLLFGPTKHSKHTTGRMQLQPSLKDDESMHIDNPPYLYKPSETPCARKHGHKHCQETT